MKRFQKGFTLIELLIVIVIIGLLGSLILAYINPLKQFANTRNGARKSDLRQIATSLQLYFVQNGAYPISTVGWCDTANTGSYACGANNPLTVLVGTYGEMHRLPVDPRDNQAFPPCNSAGPVGYLYYSNGVDYKLLAHCGPEGGTDVYKTTDPFYDPRRPTWAWQVSTPGGINW